MINSNQEVDKQHRSHNTTVKLKTLCWIGVINFIGLPTPNSIQFTHDGMTFDWNIKYILSPTTWSKAWTKFCIVNYVWVGIYGLWPWHFVGILWVMHILMSLFYYWLLIVKLMECDSEFVKANWVVMNVKTSHSLLIILSPSP